MTIQDTFKVAKRTKINLPDYEYGKDLKNRLVLFALSKTEIGVLEEILFSPLQFTIASLQANLELPAGELDQILGKLAELDLFIRDGSFLTVDKERRKYFEVQITRFEEGFTTDLEFFQNLLKTIPIQLLPIWYQIPRTSNNIFTSLIERHLLTPPIYTRYLIDFVSGDDLATQIVNDLFASEENTLPLSVLMEKYSLSRLEMEEIILYLEFNILAFLSVKEDGDRYELYLSPLEEWKNYKASLNKKAPSSILPASDVHPFRKDEYAFIEDMSRILRLSMNRDLELVRSEIDEKWTLTPYSQKILSDFFPPSEVDVKYLERIIAKLVVLGLAYVQEKTLKATSSAPEWLEIPIEQRAHITFKHPHNYDKVPYSSLVVSQRAVVEIEKSLKIIKDAGWVYFDDFLECAEIALNEDRQIKLEKQGRSWSYRQPPYTPLERDFIRYTVLTWFFESGIVRIGTHQEKPCFMLTALGAKLAS